MLLSFFLATVLAATSAQAGYEYPHDITNKISLLRTKSGAGVSFVDEEWCLSWRFGIETNNLVDWAMYPEECEGYIWRYMLGCQYEKDSKVVTEEAYEYAKNLNLPYDGKIHVWVFDIDETALTNLNHFIPKHGFRAKPSNNEHALEESPALPATLELYKKLGTLGIKVVFLSLRTEDLRTDTENNLRNVGYETWEKVILRPDSNYAGTSLEFKSGQRKKLEESKYRIVGNIGDQWSDLLGTNSGLRTFKLPNPIYHVN
ncbi:acid phosphatase 1 [Morus notabilis]|nr:acid phosphatase 1 [Morus notabilis]